MTRTSRTAALAALAPLAAFALTAACLPFGDVPPPVTLPPEAIGVVALAGPDLVALEGSRVALAGRASRAITGEPLLSWSQVGGPSVLLTNPSSSLPAFVAPLAPATLTFELRAEAAGAIATDEIIVYVVGANADPPGPAGFIDAPGDTVAEPLTTHTFRVEVKGAAVGLAPALTPALTARAVCGEGATASVVAADPARPELFDVTVALPATLPCAVIVDGVDAGGSRGLAPASRMFWPAGTLVPTATRVFAGIGGQIESGGVVTLDVDDVITADGGVRVWCTSGAADVLPGGADGAALIEAGGEIIVPRREGKLVLAAEAVGLGGSGGVEYASIDVRAGSGNLAPVASGGADRVVQPGARFRLDTAGSFDLDGDAITVTAEQVLGPSAIPDTLSAGAFQAPEEPSILLFHVVADDGAVESTPDPVRVVVAGDAENLPPLLALQSTRYAIPGETFAVDGSAAEDPDSGFIALITIAQRDDDAVILLPEPVDGARVELVAGAADDVYHFLISAYDDEGLGVSVEQTVFVEEAGPYVDAVRGDDAGNGTAASPFATVAGALSTFVRHELPELLLADGEHAPIGVVLPPRVSLRGGFVFDGAAYVADPAATTILPVTAEGLGLVDAHAAALTFSLGTAAGSVALHGSSSLAGVQIVDTADHLAPLVIVRSLAAARIDDVEVAPIGQPAPSTIVVEPGATVRLRDARVRGALGADAVGISCAAATVSLETSDIVGAALGADAGTGVRARSGCALDVTGSILSGGEATTAIGIDAEATLLTTDATSTIAGSLGGAATSTAVRFVGRERSALIKSVLLSTADVSTGLLCDDAQVGLVGAVIEAHGALSIAVQPDRCALASQDAALSAETAGVRGTLADDVSIAGGSIDAGDSGVDLDGDAARSFRDVVIRAAGVGVRALDAFIELDGADIDIVGEDDALGVAGRGVNVRNGSAIRVAGANARAVVIGDAPSSTLERSVIASSASASPAIAHVGALAIESSLVTTSAPAGTATGVASAGALTLRHATIVTTGTAVELAADATLDAANSVLAGTPAIAAAAAGRPWTQAVALAFSSALSPFVTQPGVTVTTANELDDLGCDNCLIIDVSLLVDAEGHLASGDNPLVDAGDEDLSLVDDIDGDGRPQGDGPDIGCDERTP